MKNSIITLGVLQLLILTCSAATPVPAKQTFADWVKSWAAWFQEKTKQFKAKKLSDKIEKYYGYSGTAQHPKEYEYYGYYEGDRAHKPELFGYYGYYENEPRAKEHQYYEYYNAQN